MEGDEDRTGVYSIGAVAKMVDVPAQTLRSWEDRYALIVPVRSAGGQRLYTRDHVEELRFVRDHIQSGLQPADAHRLLAERRRARANAADPTSGVVDSRDEQADDAPLAILLAERDPYAAEFAEYFLRTEGYITTIVLNGDDIAACPCGPPPRSARPRPDDFRRRRARVVSAGARHGGSLPILAVSAVASGDAALEAGADAFLQKPVQPLQFVSTVRDLLGTSAFLRRSVTVR